ncbi:MAG: ABC transporter ATP-binding protein [Alphaproteobacteria bacterium]
MFLEIDGVSVRFDGLWAVKDVCFAIEEGIIMAVIGPNGAGKTTLFNVISGFIAPTEGMVRLEGRDISGRAPEEGARWGIARTFQTPEVCRDMSVFDNALVGAHRHIRGGLAAQLLALPRTMASERTIRATAREELERTNLWALRERLASALPLGKVRLLEIARALMVAPRMMLLDEPASGLNSEEAKELAVLIREMQQRGITVLLIEHNVQFVMDLADLVAVLHNGELLSIGTPEAVRADPMVVEAYLGRQRA